MTTSILTRVEERSGPWCETGATGYRRNLTTRETCSLDDEDVLQTLQVLDDVLAECDSELEGDAITLDPIHSTNAPCTLAQSELPFSFDTIRNRVPPPTPDEAAKIVASFFPKNILCGAQAKSSDSDDELPPPSPPMRSTSLRDKPVLPSKAIRDSETILEFKNIKEAMNSKKKPPPPVPKRNPSTRLSSRSSSSSVDSPSPTYKTWNTDESPPMTMRNTQSWSGKLLASPTGDLLSPSTLASAQGIPKSSTLSTFKPFSCTPTEKQGASHVPWSLSDSHMSVLVGNTTGQSDNINVIHDNHAQTIKDDVIHENHAQTTKDEFYKSTTTTNLFKKEPYIPPPDYDFCDNEPPSFKPEPPVPKSFVNRSSIKIMPPNQNFQSHKSASPEVKIKYQEDKGGHVTCISIGEVNVSETRSQGINHNSVYIKNADIKNDCLLNEIASVPNGYMEVSYNSPNNNSFEKITISKDTVNNCSNIKDRDNHLRNCEFENVSKITSYEPNEKLNISRTSVNSFSFSQDNQLLSNKTEMPLFEKNVDINKELPKSEETVILRNNVKAKLSMYRNSIHEIKEHIREYEDSVNANVYKNNESRENKQMFRKSMHEFHDNNLVTKEFSHLLHHNMGTSKEASPTKESIHRYKDNREYVHINKNNKNVYHIAEIDNIDEFEEPPNFKPPPPPVKKKPPVDLPLKNDTIGMALGEQTKPKVPLMPPCKKRISMYAQIQRPLEPPPTQPLTRSKSLQLQLRNIAEPAMVNFKYDINEPIDNYPRNGIVSENVAVISQNLRKNSADHFKNGDSSKNGFNQNGIKAVIPKSKSINFNSSNVSILATPSRNQSASSIKSNNSSKTNKKMNSTPSLPSLIKNWCHSSSGDSSPPSPPSPTLDDRPSFPSSAIGNNQVMDVKLRQSPVRRTNGDGNQHSALVAEIQNVIKLKRGSAIYVESDKQENSYL